MCNRCVLRAADSFFLQYTYVHYQLVRVLRLLCSSAVFPQYIYLRKSAVQWYVVRTAQQ